MDSSRLVKTKDGNEVSKEWKPQYIHSKYNFKAFERILSRHRTEAQRITVAVAKRGAEAFSVPRRRGDEPTS